MRDAVARLRQAMSPAATSSAVEPADGRESQAATLDEHGPVRERGARTIEASQLSNEVAATSNSHRERVGPPGDETPSQAATVPPPSATAAYLRGLAALPPRMVRLDEPRVYIPTAAYQERQARRGALGFGSADVSIFTRSPERRTTRSRPS